MKRTILIMTCLLLTGCEHVSLKAPCGPSASLSENPCTPIPLNVAQTAGLKGKRFVAKG